MGPDASASNVAASATANHPRNKLQHHANASKAAACATVNHHQNTPQNQTKTQRHTTHENCLTSLSEALKEEVITPPRQRPDCIWRITPPRQRPDCIWRRWVHDASASNVAAPQRRTTFGTSSNTTQTHPKQPLAQQ